RACWPHTIRRRARRNSRRRTVQRGTPRRTQSGEPGSPRRPACSAGSESLSIRSQTYLAALAQRRTFVFRASILRRDAWRLPILAAAVASNASRAFAAAPVQQIEDFYYPDGTQVLGDGGMPFAHAALFRFSERRASGIMWQLMTQHLTPGACYDIWVEGTND